jgi:hypothetical protein
MGGPQRKTEVNRYFAVEWVERNHANGPFVAIGYIPTHLSVSIGTIYTSHTEIRKAKRKGRTADILTL